MKGSIYPEKSESELVLDSSPSQVKQFLRHCERGASMIEYSLLVALIAFVSIGMLSYAGQETYDVFWTLGEHVGGGFNPDPPPPF